ncbi:MAG: signal peptide peptidase SppA [Pseudomonadota bacterium]
MRYKSLLITMLIFVVLVGGAFLFGMLAYYVLSPESTTPRLFGGGQIGLVKIDGGIYDPEETVRELDKYRHDSDIKAVVVRIESPGGTVAGSQEIYNALLRLGDKKPVVASMGTLAASGGYYVACGADKILANPGSITGSIGVRFDHLDVSKLMQWAKLDHQVLKSGKYKDIASPERALTPEERSILEQLLKNIHEQFKLAVATSRNFDEQQIEKVADGRIFSGEEALALGLVDKLGDQYDAEMLAAELAGIKGEPDVVEKYKKQEGWMQRFFEASAEQMRGLVLQISQQMQEPLLLYWSH